MLSEEDFEEIRPYRDSEINPALNRLISDPFFRHIPDFFFPDQEIEMIKQQLSSINSSHEFQKKFVYPLLLSIVKRTSTGFTHDGFEKLRKDTPYLFVANHRDIVLDSSFLQAILLEKGYVSTEITFGSNLMKGDFVIDFGKVNRMFRLERGGNKTELLKNSRRTSAYIRHTITNKKLSVWIAQRPGRTKNGNDRTEAGLLKMFNMSSCNGFTQSFTELNIVPLVISYEYEPCCAYKIKEVLETGRSGAYEKQPGEDLKSIICGITQPKGRIHMTAGDPLNTFLHRVPQEGSLNSKLSCLAALIDEQVYRNYRLWPANYIAFDILNNADCNTDKYTSGEKEAFLAYMDKEIIGIDSNRTEVENTLLRIYANPVINFNREMKLI
jgi:hypothetical protein